MKNYGYPKAEKLKSKKEIEQLFAKGRWKTCGRIRIIVLKEDGMASEETNKIGFSVSKKFFKKAVYRNRTKRLLRECYRLNKTIFKECFGDGCTAMIFWISADLPKNHKDVETEFINLCRPLK